MRDVEIGVLSAIEEPRQTERKGRECSRSQEVHDLMEKLRKDETKIMVVTDKTNTFKLVRTEDYNSWMLTHLDAAAKPITKRILGKVINKA